VKCLLDVGDYEQADQWITTGINTCTENTKSKPVERYRAIAFLLASRGSLEDSLQSFEKAITINTSYNKPEISDRAAVYYTMRDFPKALADIEHSLAVGTGEEPDDGYILR
jgi:tetratricopeptide (TPR) repeat protein